MASCQCSNIEIMQIFYELKQKFPFVPDHIVSQCILQNAHNKNLCENELAEENSRYLTHCFPQGLVDKMAEDNALERGFARRSLDSGQCARRKSSDESKSAGRSSKKQSGGLPPKHTKHLSLHGHRKKDKVHVQSMKVDHRGNLERYNKFDEGKYKKLDDITNAQHSDSEADKLYVAQQMLGLKDDDKSISTNSRWNYHRSVSSSQALVNNNSSNNIGTRTSADRGTMKLDLTPDSEVSTFHLNVPSSSGPCVSVLSYSAPTTPLSSTPPLFPPLAVDVHTGGTRTSLSLEPLPHCGLGEESSRACTKVTLSLNDESLERPITSTSGLTYTTYSLKDGVQAQLHISIGSPSSPSSSSSHLEDFIAESEHNNNLLLAQMDRKTKLLNALKCEKERLNVLRRDITSIKENLKLKVLTTCVQQKPTRIKKLKQEIKCLEEECAQMTRACNNTCAVPLKEPPGWICVMCTFTNHHMLPKCEQCDMPRVNF